MTSGFNYQEELSRCSTMEDITGPNGLVQRMVKDAIEQIPQGEMADYWYFSLENLFYLFL